MRRIIITLTLAIAGFASLRAYAVPVAGSAVWSDAVAVTVDERLLLLSTQSERILWSYVPEAKVQYGLLKAGRKILLSSGPNLITLDRDRVESEPRTWRRIPPATSIDLWPLYNRAVPLITDGRYVWGRLDSPSSASQYPPMGAIFAASVGNVEQPPTLIWSGSTVLGNSLSNWNNYLFAGQGQIVRILDATTGSPVTTVRSPNPWASGGGPPMALTGKTLVVGATFTSQVYGYSLADVAPNSREPSPAWIWKADNETIDMIASSDQDTVFVSQATIMPYSTGHKWRTSPSSSLTALNASAGKPKWTRVLVPGDQTGMYLPLEDLTPHQGVLLTITKRLSPGLADDLDLYLREHHGGTDSDGFRYYIFSVNAKTGALNWKHETQGVDRIVAAIANMVYLGTDRDSLAQIQRWAENLATAGRPRKNLPDWKHKVQALDLSSGRLLWALQGAQFLVATEKLAYVQLEDGSVVAADSANGKIRYRYTYGGVR